MDIDSDQDQNPLSGGTGVTQGIGFAIADLDDGEIDEDYIDEDDEEGEFLDEDDADMIYEDDEDEDDEDDDDDEPGVHFEIASDDELEDDDEDEGGNGGGMSLRQIANLLNASSTSGTAGATRASIIERILASATGGGVTLRSGATVDPAAAARRQADQRERRRRGDSWWTPQKEPHPKGVELLRSGEFGGVGDWEWSWKSTAMGVRENKGKDVESGYSAAGDGGRRRPRGLSRGAMNGPGLAVKKMSRATIPNTNGTVVAHYPSVPYVGQYAKEDYSIFFAATQYYTIHLYDVSAQRSFSRPRPVARRSSSKSLSPTSPLALNALSGSTPRMPGAYSGTSGTSEPLSALTEEAAEAIDALEDDEEDEDWTDDEDEPALWPSSASRRRGVRDEDSSMKKIKTVQGEEGRWTITDCDSTRDGSRMIYSSITPYVHMLSTAEFEAEHTCLDFTGRRQRGRGFDGWGYDGFGIWSIRFSADGKEVVAGAGSGKILVYDIESEQRSLSIGGHTDDVNAVCFADESSTNILVSGSDDGYVKIWDRRSLAGGTPSGVLVGATEGITYTSPKGDGRYIVVNSKDQAARLYDLRKMRQWSEFEGERNAVVKYGQGRFDYRNSHYPTPKRIAHPLDCSVMTYRGHSVLRTLIRCHFSPRESTGQGYIYSGSADGMIHIWSLDGRVVQVLDRSQSIPLRQPNGEYSDPSAPEKRDPAANTAAQQRARRAAMYGTQDYCTRDVSWHGYEPTLMSSSWEVEGGYRRDGSIAKHEWKGLGKGGLNRLEDWVEKEMQQQGIEEEY